jgi:hypothetical protein
MAECKHKYVFKSNDSFYRENGRYSYIYTSIDYFFCEKCLDEQVKKKERSFGVHELPHNLPDWARFITNKVS